MNVHPAKTEVKFLSEKAVFDCVHYGVLGALNKKPDRPQIQFKSTVAPQPPAAAAPPKGAFTPQSPAVTAPLKGEPRKEHFFRTMTAEEYKTFSAALQDAPRPKQPAAAAAAQKIPKADNMPLSLLTLFLYILSGRPCHTPVTAL